MILLIGPVCALNDLNIELSLIKDAFSTIDELIVLDSDRTTLDIVDACALIVLAIAARRLNEVVVVTAEVIFFTVDLIMVFVDDA